MRVVRDQLFGLIGELHEIEQLGGSLGGGLPVQAIHASGEAQELGPRQSSKQRHAFGHNANLALNLDRIGIEIKAKYLDAPRSGRQQPRKHFDGGGLACTIRSEKAEELSGGNSEIHIIDGDEFSEAPAQCLRRNGRRRIHRKLESSISQGFRWSSKTLANG